MRDQGFEVALVQGLANLKEEVEAGQRDNDEANASDDAAGE
jgi:hypothetical protein